MAINSKLKLDKSGGIDIKSDSYIGLLLSVVHLGMQKNSYKGVETVKDTIFFQFELQDLVTDKGHPVTYGKCERNSMRPKANLVKLGEAFGVNMEEGLDFEELVGKPVLLDIGKSPESDKVSIRAYNKLPSLLRKEVKPLMGTPKVLLDVEELTDSQIKELPEWVQKLVNSRVRNNSSESSNDSGDEIEL